MWCCLICSNIFIEKLMKYQVMVLMTQNSVTQPFVLNERLHLSH
ncbi:hypothetical protein [Candidatus Enterovibrio altilux]|nr:hypothetical protein [Candidatus Enterovibrio luxaltus]